MPASVFFYTAAVFEGFSAGASLDFAVLVSLGFVAVGFFGNGGVQYVSVDGWEGAELNREVENLFAALPG